MSKYLMQARSSTSGALIGWVSDTADFAGGTFPGPGLPEYVAVSGFLTRVEEAGDSSPGGGTDSVQTNAGDGSFAGASGIKVVGGTAFAFGTTTATIGLNRFAHNSPIAAGRNQANNADANVLRWGAATNTVTLGDSSVVAAILYGVASGGTHSFQFNGTSGYTFSSTVADFTDKSIRFGTNPSTGGTIRLANNTSVAWRNAGNTANIVGLQVNSGNVLVIGDSAAVNSGVEMQVGGATNFDLKIGNVFEYRFGPTGLDFFGNNIANVGTVNGGYLGASGTRGTDLTDANATITADQGAIRVLPTATLSTNRTLDIDNTNAIDEEIVAIERHDTTANTYAVRDQANTTIFTFPASTKLAATFQKATGGNFEFRSTMRIV